MEKQHSSDEEEDLSIRVLYQGEFSWTTPMQALYQGGKHVWVFYSIQAQDDASKMLYCNDSSFMSIDWGSLVTVEQLATLPQTRAVKILAMKIALGIK